MQPGRQASIFNQSQAGNRRGAGTRRRRRETAGPGEQRPWRRERGDAGIRCCKFDHRCLAEEGESDPGRIKISAGQPGAQKSPARRENGDFTILELFCDSVQLTE